MQGDQAVRVRRADTRGLTRESWLDSRHTFSFGGYQDPAHTGFRSLRVINEDRVAPGTGFGTHAHRDMEILSYVLAGTLEHRDSLGTGGLVHAGELQLMGAGTGVTHSEFNPSAVEPVHFLQIWIRPERPGLPPSYACWRPPPQGDDAPVVLAVSPDGRDGSALIRQDARVYRLRLRRGAAVTHALAPGRGAWLQVARGRIVLQGERLGAGDGAAVEVPGTLRVAADEDAEALLLDLG